MLEWKKSLSICVDAHMSRERDDGKQVCGITLPSIRSYYANPSVTLDMSDNRKLEKT